MVHLDWILNSLERHPFFAYFAQDFWPSGFFWIFPSLQVMQRYSWACLHLKERKDLDRPCFKLIFYNFHSINDRRFVGRKCVLCNLIVNYSELKTILMPSNGFWKGTIRQNTGSVKVSRHFSRIIAIYQHEPDRWSVSGRTWSSPDRVNIYALFCSLYIFLCIVV